MNLYRIGVLLVKEFRLGGMSLMFVIAVVMPVVLSLLLKLVFGDVLAQTPRLGIHDAGGNSVIASMLVNHPGVDATSYASDEALRDAVERGAVEVGFGFPENFDTSVVFQREDTDLKVYRWGEASINSLLLLETSIAKSFMDGTGMELPVKVTSHQLGEASTLTWSERLMPVLIIMSVMLGGLLIPASSLIFEKEKRTLSALTATPTTLWDVYLAKIITGVIISTICGVVILLFNGMFTRPVVMVLVIGVGAIFASAIGAMIGSYANDMDTFNACVKLIGIVLYAPGLVEMFPSIPQWIGKLFPTYYMMNPLLEVSQNGAGWADVASDVLILAVITGVMLFVLHRIVIGQAKQIALAS